MGAAAAAPEEYGLMAAAVLLTLNGLRGLGLDLLLRRTIVGSVVEAIAGVTLPRAAGTCTRCPTEVRMRTLPPANGTWRGRFLMRREYDPAGQPLAERPPEAEFCTVTHPAHIAACVTAAQALPADGSAATPSRALLALGGPSSYELRFKYNSVVLEIDGAEADLTIVDLPGIIQSHPEGPELVALVGRMTRESIAPAHHTIVMTLTATDDLENQAINGWARDPNVDPTGARTLAVLTKPDLIPEGTHDNWVQLASSGPHYVVKNPGQDRLQAGITSEAAREEERRFFEASPHWAASPAAAAGRLGTRNLRAGLSALLVQSLKQQLPDIRRRAEEELRRVRRRLAELPPAPSRNPQYELQGLLRRVADQLQDELNVRGRARSSTFREIKGAFDALDDALVASMPAFYLGGRLFSALGREDRGLGCSEGGGGSGGGEQSDSVDELDVAALLRKPGSAKQGGLSSADEARAAAAERGSRLHTALAQLRLPVEFQTLEEVSELRREHQGPELRPFMPSHIPEKLIRRFRGDWQRHADECLAAVVEVVGTVIERLVVELFGRYPRAVRSALAEHIAGLQAATRDQLFGLVAMEDHNVFVRHETDETYFAAFLATLKRAHVRMQFSSMETLQKPAALLNEVPELRGALMAGALLLPTSADDELKLMAACLAYYKVAFRRTREVLPLIVQETLLNKLSQPGNGLSQPDGLQWYLQEALLGEQPDAAAAADLLHECEHTARRRTELADIERRLKQASKLLQSPGLPLAAAA
ncbi:Interferon-induced GTP-binding protein Mx1 [Tetrabaena socialis]|uniref:Interferon-induced GTP-binding protein Mx1 n=1 Tax=Tetrabaena socialis TaxID=47790 RepID=A0A2J7ZTS4_9CHLO|nr:Interferon-induced GTP-binding protein Mx1 [Tetrabaena socialis]|eukprot:PNH03669.1 Interferon-induced GTP-binding protein Mx1 [Tetrabaena socialis]